MVGLEDEISFQHGLFFGGEFHITFPGCNQGVFLPELFPTHGNFSESRSSGPQPALGQGVHLWPLRSLRLKGLEIRCFAQKHVAKHENKRHHETIDQEKGKPLGSNSSKLQPWLLGQTDPCSPMAISFHAASGCASAVLRDDLPWTCPSGGSSSCGTARSDMDLIAEGWRCRSYIYI